MFKNASLSLKVFTALGVFLMLLGFGDSLRGVVTRVSNLGGTNVAAVTSARDTGQRIASVVDDVVKNIRAQHPNSKINHAHVLAVMCQELPSLQIADTNSEGRQEGYTQVITDTYLGVVSGNYVDGTCKYTAGLENSACASLSARTANARCSIEVGACYFDYWLTKCNGDAACAYNGYNTGNKDETANGARDFAEGLNNLLRGQLCEKASHNIGVWSNIIESVRSITGGTFGIGTTDSAFIPVSAANLTSEGIFGGLTGTGRGFLSSSNADQDSILTRLFGTSPQNSRQSAPTSGQRSSGGVSGGSSGSLSPSLPSSPSRTTSGGGSSSLGTQTGSFGGAGSTDSGELARLQEALSFGNLGASSTPIRTQTPAPSVSVIHDATPTLLCLPSPIASGEEALILWACRDEAYTAKGENFDTNGAVIGTARVTPAKDTTYTVTCVNATKSDDTASSCTMRVANPMLALISTPGTGVRGRSVTLSWQTKDISACVLTSPQHPTFERKGIQGDVTSPTLSRETQFTLTCESVTGALEEKEITVTVQ